jgi:hypothetical protein
VKALGTIYRYWTLIFLAVVTQIAAAAYGAFYSAQKLGDQKGPDATKLISEKTFDHGFDFHIGFGYIIFLGAIVLFLLALEPDSASGASSSRSRSPWMWPSRSSLRGSARAPTASGSSMESMRSSSSVSPDT